jgi:hypothetical protein
MKLQPGKRKKLQGNIILMCIIFSFVLGITIASYLDLVQNQYNSTIRSHDWNTAMVLAEAGIEDGMSFINKYAGNYDAGSTNWADTAVADGWTNINGNVYHTQRTPDATLGCYDVWVTNYGNTISVCAVGTATWNQQPVTGPQVPSSTPVHATPGMDLSNIVRQVLVQTTNDPLFSVAFGCTGPINLNGNNLNTDSFDSSDTNLSNGLYNQAMRKANSVLATDAGITNVGAPTLIYGSINTGPGGETNVQPNGSVGDMTWMSTTMGIQPGHAQDDMNMTFQNVMLPQTNWIPLVPSEPFTTPMTISNSGYYEVNGSYGLTHSLTIAASNVVLYLSTGVGYGGYGGYGGQRTITVTNGSVAIYASGTVNLGNNGNIVNATGNAANLYFYGLTNLTSLNLGSVSNFVGAIYAPQAGVVLGNNGSPAWFTGSCISQSITLNGNVQVHYDENLRRIGPYRAFVPISWTEF